jgi:hypothetical protein
VTVNGCRLHHDVGCNRKKLDRVIEPHPCHIRLSLIGALPVEMLEAHSNQSYGSTMDDRFLEWPIPGEEQGRKQPFPFQARARPAMLLSFDRVNIE